ncbi:hypothetical protein CBL_09948 [Carabus blaptoides fortunei]
MDDLDVALVILLEEAESSASSLYTEIASLNESTRSPVTPPERVMHLEKLPTCVLVVHAGVLDRASSIWERKACCMSSWNCSADTVTELWFAILFLSLRSLSANVDCDVPRATEVAWQNAAAWR